MYCRLLINMVLLSLLMKNAFGQSSVKAKIKQVETGLRKKYPGTDSLFNSLLERMQHHKVPGVSIAVVNNFKIEWVKAYGVKDAQTREPLTTTTKFQVASLTKPIVAMATMKLVEKGRLSLEENIDTYLRSWQLPDNSHTTNRKVTIKDLLSHTAGITGGGFDGYKHADSIPTLLAILDGKRPATNIPFTIDTIPGTTYNYSGPGYLILQQALVDITQQPFPDLIKQLVLAPLGMNNSVLEPTGKKVRNYASGHFDGHVMDNGGKYRIIPELAAGGLWSTAKDMARFGIEVGLSLQNRSNRVLSKSTVEAMLTPVRADYGLGIRFYQKDFNYFGHGGENPGYISRMFFHKTKGYGVVILVNNSNDELIKEIIRSIAAAYQWDDFEL